MTLISLKLPDELISRLIAQSRRRGSSRSALMREALESYLAARGARGGSAAERAADLSGRFDGPRDLSHHPRHIRGFGD